MWEITDLETAVLVAIPQTGARDLALLQAVATEEGASQQTVRLALESLHRHGAVIRLDGMSWRTARGRDAAGKRSAA